MANVERAKQYDLRADAVEEQRQARLEKYEEEDQRRNRDRRRVQRAKNETTTRADSGMPLSEDDLIRMTFTIEELDEMWYQEDCARIETRRRTEHEIAARIEELREARNDRYAQEDYEAWIEANF